MSRRTRSSRATWSPQPVITKISKKSPPPKRRLSTHSLPKISTRDNLASDQRAIFDWYEKNQYKDDAGEIFSPDWQYRLSEWREEFDDDIQTICHKLQKLENNPEKLEFGLFFRAHPVAAFSLWNVLHACYDLDRRICGKSAHDRKTIAKWQNLRPFEYLLSGDIISTWERNLVSFSQEVEESSNIFQKEMVVRRLYSLAEGVHELEEGLPIVESVFEGNKENLSCSYWMLDLIRKGVDDRCLAIEKYITHHRAGL